MTEEQPKLNTLTSFGVPLKMPFIRNSETPFLNMLESVNPKDRLKDYQVSFADFERFYLGKACIGCGELVTETARFASPAPANDRGFQLRHANSMCVISDNMLHVLKNTVLDPVLSMLKTCPICKWRNLYTVRRTADSNWIIFIHCGKAKETADTYSDRDTRIPTCEISRQGLEELGWEIEESLSNDALVQPLGEQSEGQ